MNRHVLQRAFAVLSLAAAACTLPSGVQAQWSEELSLGVHGALVSVGGDRGDDGIGYGGTLTYAPSDLWALVAGLDAASLNDGTNDYNMRHLDLALRLTPLRTRIMPFGTLGYTWRSAHYDDIFFMGETTDVKLSGNGLTFGAGLSYRITGSLDLETAAAYTTGELDRVTVDRNQFRNDDATIDGGSLRLRVGASLVILRRR